MFLTFINEVFSFLFLVLDVVGSVCAMCIWINKGFCHKSRTKIILFLPRRLEIENYPSIMSIFVWKYIIKFRHALICLSLIFSFVLSTHSLTICPSNKCEMSLSFWDLPLFWAIEHFPEIHLFKFLSSSTYSALLEATFVIA